MGIIVWIVFGAIVGWVGSIIMGTDNQQGLFLNVVVGVIGAMLGGYVMSYFGETGITGFNLYSFVVAIFGAVALLAIVRLVRQN